jgi:2-polyprenyl-3-methyl-5-hydroxy-6-metoxy-1,4-benzoquinol methylase
MAHFAIENHPNLHHIVAALEAGWPEHRRFLAKRFAECTDSHLRMAETVAALILRLTNDNLEEFIADYRWHCGCLVQEQEHFMRTGSYRLTSFADAVAEIYENTEYMRRYMNALLLTQAIWSNHTEALQFYTEHFLRTNPDHYHHLEIGPGHGLLLYFVALDQRAQVIEAWDVSDASLTTTRHSLARLGIERPVSLCRRNVLAEAVAEPVWDSVVISEVLEHLEAPARALTFVRQSLRPGGRAYINVPVNCPAPDHIFLFSTPEEVIAAVRASGLKPIERGIFPASGYTEDKARKMKSCISCAVIAEKPA